MKTDVLIIGAGLSGLLIAKKLKEMSIDVMVVEARDRIGGRIHTVKSVNETPVEMGATWFGSQHTHLRALLTDLKFPVFEQFIQGTTFYEPVSSSPAQALVLPTQEPSYRLAGGSVALVDHLASFLTEAELLLKNPVNKIQFLEEIAEIETAEESIKARQVISTLPPALLIDSIQFDPELPKQLIEIAANTHTWMHESIKAAVIYDRPFWKEKGLAGTLFSNVGPVREFYDHSNAADSRFALCGFVNDELSRLTIEERKEKVMEQLVRIYGHEAESFLAYEEQVWSKEQFTTPQNANGLFPHQNNGHSIFTNFSYDARLYIAGTETSPTYGGYMEGAVYAALSVVEKIKKDAKVQGNFS